MKPFQRLLFLLSVISIPLNSPGQEKDDIEKRIAGLIEIEAEDLKDSVEVLIPELYKFDQVTSLTFVREMARCTKDRSHRAYFICLSLLPEFSPGRELELLDSAYIFSVKNKLDYYKWDYYINKSIYSRNKSMLDSSIYYLLKARDYAIDIYPERYIRTLNQLGDLYYSVGLYDDAERYYHLIQQEEKDTKNPSWEVWRKVVIRNNLGLIDIAKERYDAALEKFYQTVRSEGSELIHYSDSLTVGYASRKIAEIHYLTGNYEEAFKILEPWYLFFKKHQLENHLFPAFHLLIRLSIKMGNKEAVEGYFGQYIHFLQSAKSSEEYNYLSAKISSEVYEFLGDESMALKYYKKYSELKDSLDSKNHQSGLIQLLAEKNYENLEENLDQVKSQRYYLLIIVAVLLFSAVVIYMRSRRVSKLNLMLMDANHTKEKLFSIIAHDLRNPFNIILGYSSVLLERYNDFDEETIKSILNDLKYTGDSTYALLENLLNWSHSQRHVIDFSPERIVLSEMVPALLEQINSLAKKKEIELINYVSEQNAIVYADKNMLSLVFRNLLTNAVKFSNVGGKIIIDMDCCGSNTAVFKIKDEGVGIAPEKAKTLFVFGKNDCSCGTEGEKGTGLGLVLCKEFVLKHEGKIWVESEPGKGSTFCFTIPLG